MSNSPPASEQPGEATAKQVEDMLSSPELVHAVENADCKAFLDHIPIGIAVGRNGEGHHRIVYVNPALESLSGLTATAMK